NGRTRHQVLICLRHGLGTPTADSGNSARADAQHQGQRFGGFSLLRCIHRTRSPRHPSRDVHAIGDKSPALWLSSTLWCGIEKEDGTRMKAAADTTTISRLESLSSDSRAQQSQFRDTIDTLPFTRFVWGAGLECS